MIEVGPLKNQVSQKVGSVKGTMTRDGYFFKGLNILISTFCVCAVGFQDLSKAVPYTIINFLVVSLKLLTNFENSY